MLYAPTLFVRISFLYIPDRFFKNPADCGYIFCYLGVTGTGPVADTRQSDGLTLAALCLSVSREQAEVDRGVEGTGDEDHDWLC